MKFWGFEVREIYVEELKTLNNRDLREGSSARPQNMKKDDRKSKTRFLLAAASCSCRGPGTS